MNNSLFSEDKDYITVGHVNYRKRSATSNAIDCSDGRTLPNEQALVESLQRDTELGILHDDTDSNSNNKTAGEKLAGFQMVWNQSHLLQIAWRRILDNIKRWLSISWGG